MHSPRQKTCGNCPQIKISGFQLIELLIVLAMIGLLAMSSVPIYTDYLARAHRMDAAAQLTQLAAAMETYYIEHQTYRGATLFTLHLSEWTSGNFYRLNIQSADEQGFLLTAIPTSSTKICQGLTLNANNERGVIGAGTVADCW